MRKLLPVALLPILAAGCVAWNPPAVTPNPAHTLTVESEILGETRRVYVQLPEGYGRSEARYPVLVVLDGEWLFEPARALVRFQSEYDVMDVRIPKMIVVGIENVDRDRDYVPTPDRVPELRHNGFEMVIIASRLLLVFLKLEDLGNVRHDG